MKEFIFGTDKIIYECEIGYSQGVILFDLLFGFFLIFGGIALAIWIKSWFCTFWSFLGVFSVWQATKRFHQQNPQIKIGKQGLWTRKTGFLPWAKVLPLIKTEIGSRYTSTHLVLFNRFNQQQELTRFSMRELDIDARLLQAYINQFAPKLS